MSKINHSIETIIDFFVNKNFQYTDDELNQKRILIQILLTILFMNIVTFAFGMLGYFSNELTFGLFLFGMVGLAIIKYSNSNLLISTFINGTLMLTVIINVVETGDIYSYNNKWFIGLLLLVNMIAKKQTVIYLFLYLILQFVFYHYTTEDMFFISNKEEYLVDNLFAIVLAYSFTQIFNRLEKLQWTRIDEQNSLLIQQKKALIESNQLLQNQSKQLLASNQELERFAYIASHDLKTPLSNIINFSKLLKSELKDINNSSIHQYVSFIEKGSHKMNVLIEDVLEYSKLSSNSMGNDKTNLNTILQSITDSISEYIHEENAQVKIDGSFPTIKAHRTKMYLLFKNLIENGIKYNQSNSPLIEISFQKKEFTYLFSVKDNGIGISPEFQHKIFDMFTRLHRDTQYEGTGLGLALCKKIVLSLEGEIFVISEKNKGSAFFIEIDKKYFL